MIYFAFQFFSLPIWDSWYSVKNTISDPELFSFLHALSCSFLWLVSVPFSNTAVLFLIASVLLLELEFCPTLGFHKFWESTAPLGCFVKWGLWLQILVTTLLYLRKWWSALYLLLRLHLKVLYFLQWGQSWFGSINKGVGVERWNQEVLCCCYRSCISS